MGNQYPDHMLKYYTSEIELDDKNSGYGKTCLLPHTSFFLFLHAGLDDYHYSSS